jgi:O-antigen/teichoic acid export membrane protein
LFLVVRGLQITNHKKYLIIVMLQVLASRFLGNALIRRMVKNSGYLVSATGISAALSMVQGILAARLLGVADFGVLGTITVFTSVVNRFASFRMGELVIKYVGEYSEHQEPEKAAAVFKAAALVEMGASLAAFGLLFILSPFGSAYFAKDPALQDWFLLYALIVLANFISESSTGLLQLFDRFRAIAAVNILQSAVTLALIVLAYVTHGGLFHVLASYVVGKTVGALSLTGLALLEARRRWGRGWWRAPLGLLRPQARELVSFGVSTNLSATLSLVNKDSELLWVALFRSDVETGYYKLALALANIIQLPVSPLPQATYPEISREVARRDWKNVRYIFRQGSIMAGGYTLAATLGLFLFGNLIIRLFYGAEFLPAFPALMILLVGFLVANTFYWHRTALLALGRPDYPTKMNLALAVLKVLGVLLLVPRLGYLANAALLAGSYVIGVGLSTVKALGILGTNARREPAAPTAEGAA